MRILLTTPAPPGSHSGNRVTADRWRAVSEDLGHTVEVVEPSDVEAGVAGDDSDLLVALHARRSAAAIRAFTTRHPRTPVVLALTGTDLYRDLADSRPAQRALRSADRFVVLQARGVEQVPADLRDRVHVIHQSVPPIEPLPAREGVFEVAVLAHLRPVKDPLRTAAATRGLPDDSRIRVTHLGAALDADCGRRAREETAGNPRYEWLGEVPRDQALEVLARSRLLSVTSKLEGGANVVSEAIAAGVPVVSSRIDGSVGILGDDYPGYFPVGDTAALTDLLARAEADADGLYTELERRVGTLAPLVDPARERRAWQDLISALIGD